MPKNDLSQARRRIEECQETKRTDLDLGNCGIVDLDDISILFECGHLESLTFSDSWFNPLEGARVYSKNVGKENRIRSFTKSFGRLNNLRHLVMVGCFDKNQRCIDLTGLSSLTHLDLSFNQFTTVKNLDCAKSLKHLSLKNNLLSEIRNLEALKALNSIDLSLNQLTEVILSGLYELTSINISSNQLAHIKLEGLRKLTHLNLNRNRLSKVEELEALGNLKYLDLSSNEFIKVPKSLLETFNLEIGLYTNSDVKLGDNPIQTPPLEVVKQGRQAMLDWYAANKKELKEIKVILIGDPKAGKTSLLKRLKNDDFDENEVQTDGINIEDVAFETCGTFDEQKELHGLTAHFWDFGGQEIMNATHQFFLTNRSVYIIVLDARKDTKSGEQVSNWVRRIKATSGKSPILVVANQIDVNTSFGFENVTELRKEFPEIKGFIKASCKEEGHEGITAIKHQLAGLIPQAELFNTEIDERWVEIKEQLQKETRANQYLNDKRFRTICKKFELPEKEKQVNAIQFLHDLGIVLHFNEVKAYKYYVLDPMWITYGVYQILTSAKAGVAKGLVDVEDLDYIVNEEEDKKDSYRPKEFIEYHYDHSERLFLVDVLHQFKLCFYQPDRQKFILPDLLDTAEPTETTDAIRSEDGNIHFVYDYDYLPKSTMPRIMVENHTNLVAMWRTGCVLQKGQCHAIVSSYQNQLSLLVSGSSPEKREFMSILRHKIDQINSGLTQKPDMLIPLPGTEEFADYEELLEREKDGEKTYKLYKPIKKEFTISELLEGIAREDEMRRDMQKILMYQRQQRKGQQLISDQLDRIEETGKATLSEVQATNLRLEEAIKHLLALPDLAELEAMTRRLWEDNHQLLEAKSTEELQNVSTDLMRFIKTGFEQHQEQFDTQLTAIYQDLSKSDNTALKVKVGIPLIGLLGINVEGEWDVKNWAKEMEEKYRWEIFKGLQKLGYFR